MKFFYNTYIARRKLNFIAILLPVLVVAFLSLNTFFKRREAVNKLLDSNINISCETVLQEFETAMGKHEQEILNSGNFITLLNSAKSQQKFIDSNSLFRNSAGQLFLLDSNYQIIFPKTGAEEQAVFGRELNLSDNQFEQTLKNAEFFELSQSDYDQAVRLYEECLNLTSSSVLRAFLLERLGRCLFKNKKFDRAKNIYEELFNKYPDSFNNAGQPYGITAGLELYEIAEHQNDNQRFKVLIDLYKKISKGTWLLNSAQFEFFISEIDSKIENISGKKNFDNYFNSYFELKQKISPYKQALELTELLTKIQFPK